MTNLTKTKAMATLFCAIVAARKSHRSLEEMLRIIPVSPAIKAMALRTPGFEAAR